MTLVSTVDGDDMNRAEHQRRSSPEEWLPVSFGEGQCLSHKQAQTWALVLESRSIPCHIEETEEGYRLLVPQRNLESARAEIRLYEEKNRDWPPPPTAARALLRNTLPTLSILILLATFHNLTLLGISPPGRGPVDLVELGVAHAASIREGEWWRLITALTLHGDFEHLLGNLAIGGLVIIQLCRELGSGLAWCLLLASGTLGNLVNALLQSPDHRSLGASTALFGAVGIFSAISMLSKRRQLPGSLLAPLAAGLALLAVLGSEGKQTDLGAHLFGFVSGLLLGLLTEYRLGGRTRPGRLLNALLALAAATLVVSAWWAALFLGQG